MNILCRLGFHKWKVTARNGIFYIPLDPVEKTCERCLKYQHRTGDVYPWKEGKHPRHDRWKDNFTESHTQTI